MNTVSNVRTSALGRPASYLLFLARPFALGPRATPTVDGDLVYVLGAMGNLFALNVKDGSVAWQKNFVDEFDATIPSWGATAAPLVDGDRFQVARQVSGEEAVEVIDRVRVLAATTLGASRQ